MKDNNIQNGKVQINNINSNNDRKNSFKDGLIKLGVNRVENIQNEYRTNEMQAQHQ